MRISDWSSDVCSSDLAFSEDAASSRKKKNFANTAQFAYLTTLGGSVNDAADSYLVLHLTHLTTRRKRSEEHTSELQSLMRISYAVFCLKKKINLINITPLIKYTYSNKRHIHLH